MHFQDPCQHGHFLTQPHRLFWMAPTPSQDEANLADPMFFASQSQKLNALLSTVVRESSKATNPDAAIDFMQLSEIITGLLEEAQMFSVLSGEDLMQRIEAARTFMGKIETVQSVIEDWDVRTTTATSGTSSPNDVRSGDENSRKRARTMSSTAWTSYNTRSNRRRMQCETEQALSMAPAFDGPFAEMIPLSQYVEREKEKAEWWTQPYYD